MNLSILRTEIWNALGKDTTLDPASDVSYNSGPLLTLICNEGQRQIATWKDPRTGKRTRFRELVSDLYFKSKVITGNLAAAGAVATSNSIKFSSTYVGNNDGRYNGWLVSCASQRRLLVKYSGGGYSSAIHAPWTTNPSNTASYALFKNFYYFLSSGHTWLSSPSGEHITLPSVSDRFKPQGNFLEVLNVEDATHQRDLERANRTESFAANTTDAGDASQWYRFGTRLYFDRATPEAIWFRLEYYRLPTDMSGAADVPEIPEMFHYAITIWGRMWGHMRKHDHGMYALAEGEFTNFMRSRLGVYEVQDEREEAHGSLRRDYT